VNPSLSPFQKKQYLNLETFRKSGQGVRTPVWFAQDGDCLYVWTESASGKAKRIRANGRVNVAPCKVDGTVLGEWIAAQASVDASGEGIEHVGRLMRKKYGLLYRLFAWQARRGGGSPIAVRIQPGA
jgi:PPOX class probable F420-dependent enzyme